METNKHLRVKNFIRDKAYLLILVICLVVTASVTFLLQDYTSKLLRNRLDQRLIAIVSTAALQFDANEISLIKEKELESVKNPVYLENVFKLQGIKFANEGIRYVYIMSQTDDINTVKYVVDSDAASIVPTLDYNEDGEINDLDVSKPGDIYDATEAPALQGPAFISPTVDDELTVDTWGTFLSAYAPIIDKSNNVVGTLVIDVNVDEYIVLIQETFLPFALFVALLLVLISGLTYYIVKAWRIKVEIVKEVDRQKDELLSIVSHQLATPVSSVKWYLEMMKDGDLGPLNEEQIKHVTSMQDVASNLSDLVSMILDVSRIQLGKMHIEKQELDLNNFFKEILDIIEPKALEKKVNLVNKLPAKMPVAQLDKRYTHMTIENLLSNAIKYTPENGEVDFTVTIEGNILRCVVKDTGVGIPKADQDKIFGKLFRASNVRNTVDGNGFGLYVAKGAVEAQGGNIKFQSAEGKGTTFFVELPLK